jgi:hypothetical protein
MMARQRSRWTRWECAKQGLTYYHLVQDEADKTLCRRRIGKQARRFAISGLPPVRSLACMRCWDLQARGRVRMR